MLLFIITTTSFLVLWLITLGFWIQVYKYDSRYYRDRGRDRAELWTTVSGVVSIFYLAFIIVTLNIIARKPIDYIEVSEQRQSLESRLAVYMESEGETDFKDIGWQQLYKDMETYNTTVKTHKYRQKQLFWSWYYNKQIAELEPLEYEDYGG